jgi:hypothetical protein
MATAGPDTGNGATVTFPSLSITPISITIGERTVEMLDISTLATTTFMKKLVADLVDAGTVTVTFHPDETADTPQAKATGSLVLTWPLVALATAANITGTASITGQKYPDFANNQVQVSSLTFTYDGATGPTFTAESA